MFHYKSCGLENVYLVNGYIKKETPFGEAVSIEDIEGLHAKIAETIIRRESELSGREFRFLRKYLDLSQGSLGKLLGVTDQTIANYEKGTPTETAERFIRVLVTEHINGSVQVLDLLSEISDLDKDIAQSKLVFKVLNNTIDAARKASEWVEDMEDPGNQKDLESSSCLV
ncbi:helix-turn-helix domain-containing protein [Alkalimonas sp. NCh-2]|uniref:helix-turn-helix domain-containing protein n=1 Tax=Alkalimonas sp. NCh-2 TaxID=3144846 RepID=UPI0031F6EAE5